MNLTYGMKLLDSGGPYFCRWGVVKFPRMDWIIARDRDGALATTFRMGKGIVHYFPAPEDALQFLLEMVDHGAKAERTSIVRMCTSHYNCDEKGLAFVKSCVEAGKPIGLVSFRNYFHHVGSKCWFSDGWLSCSRQKLRRMAARTASSSRKSRTLF